MVSCIKDKGYFTIKGLTIEDIELIQEGLHRLFNESQKNEHRNFRSQVLNIDRAIDPKLEEHFYFEEF